MPQRMGFGTFPTDERKWMVLLFFHAEPSHICVETVEVIVGE
jgi:hypothetical protein